MGKLGIKNIKGGGTGEYQVKRAWRARVEIRCEMVTQKVDNLEFNGRYDWVISTGGNAFQRYTTLLK